MDGSQIDFLYRIAALRNEWLDLIFRFLNYFDTGYFPMVVIPIVWIGISYRWGLKFALLFTLNALLNYHLKYLFDLPRPVVEYPDLAMLSTSSPGFPSGAAQTAMLVGGFLIYGWKSKWAWVIAIPYILLISFSRLYLGVHYPMDILGGWIFGLALLLVFIFCIKPLERFLHKQGPGFSLFLYILFLPHALGVRFIGAFLGFGVGAYLSIYLSLYPTHHRSFQTRVLSALFAVLSTFAVYSLIPQQMPPAIFMLVGALWISLCASPFSKMIVQFVLPDKRRT